MQQLVINQATCSRTGLPTGNCNCGVPHTQNESGTEEPETHTNEAMKATMQTKSHLGSFGHAALALQHAKDGEMEEAAASHLNAARTHERQATKLRRDGDGDEAEKHDNAASLHRKAASMHKASMTDNAADAPWPMQASVVFNYTDGPASFDRTPPLGQGGSHENPNYGPAPRVIRSVSDLLDDVPQYRDRGAAAELVGRQATPDGRVLGAVSSEGRSKFAGAGEFDMEEENNRRISKLSMASNADARWAARQLAAWERGGTPGGIMEEIVRNRRAEMAAGK